MTGLWGATSQMTGEADGLAQEVAQTAFSLSALSRQSVETWTSSWSWLLGLGSSFGFFLGGFLWSVSLSGWGGF